MLGDGFKESLLGFSISKSQIGGNKNENDERNRTQGVDLQLQGL